MAPGERKTAHREGTVTPSAVARTDVAVRSHLWNIPPANPFFYGREAYLQELHDILTTDNQPAALMQAVTLQAIKGLGGLGKTQTAFKYADRYEAEYTAGFSTIADSRESLVSGFAGFARRMDLPEKDDPEIVRAATAAKRWFESNSNWLLILDNVEDYAAAKEWIPSGKRGHAQGLDLPNMPTDEGASFLLDRSKISNPTGAELVAAQSIAEEFGGLPLGLEQAGACIEEAMLSPSEYLGLYRLERKKLRARGGEIADHETVTVTFTLAFQKLSEAWSDPQN